MLPWRNSHIAIDYRSWQRQNNPTLVLSETDDESSSLAAAPAAVPTHVASCFDANGWRYLIGTVKDLKDNIQQDVIFYAWDALFYR